MLSNNQTISCETQAPGAIPIPFRCKVRDLVEKVGNTIYQPLCNFEITAWRTPEPVSFSKRCGGERMRLHLGARWGTQLFDCAWFLFTAPVPDGVDVELVARIDINGELCMVDESGIPLRGLTCKKSVFDRKLGTPAKTIFAIPKNAVRNGRVELWADAGFNDLFGSIPEEGRIETADLCLCRSDIRALYYDLEFLSDYASGELGEAERDKVIAAIGEAADELGEYDAESVARARATLRPLFCEMQADGGLRVSAVGHAHLDLAWLWPIRETIRKGARTFATALYNIERYPEYVFGASQPQLFLWMKQHYPALYARIRNAVSSGRIEPQGTFWVEPDCNIPSGESFVRQILHGSQFFREEFGITPRMCWVPDVFGCHGQLPQILRKSGHDYFMTQKLSWNVVNRFPYHSFHWKGIDGTVILAHMLPEETYNSPAAPHSLEKIATNYAQRDVSMHALMVYGIGDGGGGPDAEHIERLRRAASLASLPHAEFRSAADFFDDWAADANEFPCWEGELYLERHQGTLTTQTLTKRNNRLCEIGLREVEWAGVLAHDLAGMAYPSAELANLWQEVLLYQFHDILPGSSIKRVYDECNARQAAILESIEELIIARYEALSSRIRSTASQIVFNSLPWGRTEWVKIDDRWRQLSIPPMGWSPLTDATIPFTVQAETNRIENERLRVVISEQGSIASIYDKTAGREVLAESEPGNAFVIFEDRGDAWDFETDFEKKDVWLYLRQEPKRPTLISSCSYIDGPCAVVEQVFRFASSTIRQQIVLKQGDDILEFHTEIDWNEPGTMLRVRFPVAVNAPEARFEIPFGSIHRSTGEETLRERAQVEVSAHQWVDLSDDRRGVSLLNDCKYGFRIKGRTIDMALLRSVPHPGSALISQEDRSEKPKAGEFTDLGRHRFRYALWPHQGKGSEAEITRRARALNVPLRVVPMIPHSSPCLAETQSWLRLSNPAIEIAAVKQAENGACWITRFVNVSPNVEQTLFECELPFDTVEEVDLMEAPLSPRIVFPAGETIGFSLAPFEIKTVCVTRQIAEVYSLEKQ